MNTQWFKELYLRVNHDWVLQAALNIRSYYTYVQFSFLFFLLFYAIWLPGWAKHRAQLQFDLNMHHGFMISVNSIPYHVVYLELMLQFHRSSIFLSTWFSEVKKNYAKSLQVFYARSIHYSVPIFYSKGKVKLLASHKIDPFF